MTLASLIARPMLTGRMRPEALMVAFLDTRQAGAVCDMVTGHAAFSFMACYLPDS